MNWTALTNLMDYKFRVVRVALFFALVAVTGTTSGQVSPTSEQLAIFNSLDSSQQQAILESLGQGGLSQDSSVEGVTGYSNSSASSATDVRDRETRARLAAAEGRRNNSARNTLQGEDTLLIDIGIRQQIDDTSAATSGSGPARTQGQGVQSEPLVTPQFMQEPDEPLTAKERTELKELTQRIRDRNPYRLSREGALTLPGFAPIPLQGLTVEQAAARVAAVPALRRLQLKLTLLPLEKSGVDGLKRFGYDLFDQPPSTFAPITDVPVPADYIVGVGDQLTVQLYGKQNKTVKLRVGRDGRINFPELGPMFVGGKTFTALQSEIEGQVARQTIGVNASVSMGEVRSIRVFVLGEANLPGSYTVSGLATMTAALFASGGVKQIGSLRNIQLKRQGTVVKNLDLYDLLLNGDTSNDAQLLPGDVIFIPSVGTTVAVEGEVRRPAIYEVKPTQAMADVIALAGGFTAEADTSKMSLSRIDADRKRVVLNVDVGAKNGGRLRDGDVVTVPRVVPTIDSGVTVGGHVFAPRSVAWRDGLRLSEVIGSVDELKPNADLHYVIIRRELPPNRRVAILSADLAAALADRGGAADIVLTPRDQITVFDFETDRAQIIKPILDDLRLQGDVRSPAAVVRVTGRVKVPGEYPLEPGMRVSDLLRAGGNFEDAAYVSSAELSRYTEVEGKRVTQLVTVDLDAVVRGDRSADLVLQPADMLNIKQLPQWSDQEEITLKGEVRFPGTYSIKRGETLRSVIMRAGGLTDLAFSEGSVFTRQELREREQQQIESLALRMQNDLATLALRGAQANQSQSSQTLSVGQSILAQLKQAKAVGRLVIDLDRIVDAPPGSEGDVVLRDGDTLVVPKQRQEVTVIGEVQTLTSHLYRKGLSRDDYVDLSGGLTRKADEKQVYVVRADGSVIARQTRNRWFNRDRATDMRPGDTVVVPLDTERMPALPFWQAVTQILYNVAIAAAAVNSF